LNELETVFGTQIEIVWTAKLKPTHFDWHCLHHGGSADIFDITLGLAKECGHDLLAIHLGQSEFSGEKQRAGEHPNGRQGEHRP
jgi:hypothetical protein